MRAQRGSQPLAGPAAGATTFLAVTAVRSWTRGLASVNGAEWVGVALISIAVAILLVMFVEKDGHLLLSFGEPASLYSLCYGIYYLLPYVLLVATGQLPVGFEVRIAWVFLLGLVSFAGGYRLRRGSRDSLGRIAEFGLTESLALMGLGIVGIGLVSYYFGSRIAEGTFVTHGRDYIQAPTVLAGFRDVFAGGWQLPTVLVFALAGSCANRVIRRRARLMCWGYGISLMLVLLFSSQTRPAIILLILLVSLDSFRGLSRIRTRKLAVLGAGAVACVLFVQGVRTQQGEFLSAANQLRFAAERSWAAAASGVTHESGVIYEQVSARMSGSVDFLNLLMRVSDGAGFLLGSEVASWATPNIPRVLWSDKPVTDAPPQSVQLAYGIPRFDAPLGAVLELFIQAGAIGVALGFLVLGMAMQKVAKWLRQSGSAGAWLVFVFVLPGLLNLELEMMQSILGALRNGVIAWVMYRVLRFAVEVVRSREG